MAEEIRPEAKDTGKRLDAWLSECYPDVSRAAVRTLLVNGGVRASDGHRCSKGDRVRPDLLYTLRQKPGDTELVANADLLLDIVYEDDRFIVLSKPAGMNCLPNRANETDTLANALLARHPELRGIGDGPLTCGILHRIDGDTSGMVLAARRQSDYDALRAAFSARTVEKHYMALVSGDLRHAGHLEHYLAHNPRCPGRMIDASQWKDAKRPMQAITDYRPIRHLLVDGTPCTLLDVTILTGVTHQIRAQLSFAGHPIVGDRRYGGLQVKGFPRHFLHSLSAAFTDPVTGVPRHFEAPLTNDLADFLKHAR